MFFLGVGMFIGKFVLARDFDPNDAEVEARRLYGQSRAVLVSESEVKELETPREWQF